MTTEFTITTERIDDFPLLMAVMFQVKLTGRIENNLKNGINNPTTERILKAFDDIKLTIVHLSGQIICHLTPLTSLQVRILILLGLSATVYTRPA